MRLDGSPWVVESVSVLTRWEGEDAFQVILRNLTDRKRAEAALRYQANLVEHVSDAIIGIDTHGRVESWNRAAELIYGVPHEPRSWARRCTSSSACPKASGKRRCATSSRCTTATTATP